MKKQELRGLIEQHLTLRRQMDDLREELRELEARYAEIGNFFTGGAQRSSFTHYFCIFEA